MKNPCRCGVAESPGLSCLAELVVKVDRESTLHDSCKNVSPRDFSLWLPVNRVLRACWEEAKVKLFLRWQNLVDVFVTIVLPEVAPVAVEDRRRLGHVARIPTPHGTDLVIHKLPRPLLAIGRHAENALVRVQLPLPIDRCGLQAMLHGGCLQRAPM